MKKILILMIGALLSVCGLAKAQTSSGVSVTFATETYISQPNLYGSTDTTYVYKHNKRGSMVSDSWFQSDYANLDSLPGYRLNMYCVSNLGDTYGTIDAAVLRYTLTSVIGGQFNTNSVSWLDTVKTDEQKFVPETERASSGQFAGLDSLVILVLNGASYTFQAGDEFEIGFSHSRAALLSNEGWLKTTPKQDKQATLTLLGSTNWADTLSSTADTIYSTVVPMDFTDGIVYIDGTSPASTAQTFALTYQVKDNNVGGWVGDGTGGDNLIAIDATTVIPPDVPGAVSITPVEGDSIRFVVYGIQGKRVMIKWLKFLRIN